jgi:putative ABC transport system permease protein
MAAIGIYGVVSYRVSERTREIGIRTALGAQRRDVLRLILRQGLLLMVAGIAAGGVLAVALTRLIARLLFGVTPTDPVTFAAVSAVLFGVAAIATYLPARKAASADPIAALRYQ